MPTNGGGGIPAELFGFERIKNEIKASQEDLLKFNEHDYNTKVERIEERYLKKDRAIIEKNSQISKYKNREKEHEDQTYILEEELESAQGEIESYKQEILKKDKQISKQKEQIGRFNDMFVISATRFFSRNKEKTTSNAEEET